MKLLLVFLIFSLNSALFAQSQPGSVSENQSDTRNLFNKDSDQDELAQAYRILTKSGVYEDKKQVMKVLSANYQQERVVDMIIDLLTYTYDNPSFKENDQEQYYDDVIAENLVKLLGKNGNPKSFPALLKIVLYNRHHRDSTVKEAWNAIMAIKW